MNEIKVSVRDGEGATDLREWLSAQGYESSSPKTDSMGTTEIVIISVSSAAVARGAVAVLIEWIRSRRTTVELMVGETRGLKLDVTADQDKVLNAIKDFDRKEQN